jgi:hypothetical protein
MRIYVQIASYRDTELIPTIKDCLENAKTPENLTFGVFLQYGDEISSEEIHYLSNIPNLRLVLVPYEESKGACWARNKLNTMIEDEEFALQLDSHHRFIKDWDEQLLSIWHSLDDKKAIITGYPPNYTPGEGREKWYNVPQICNVYKFNHNYPISRPANMKDYKLKSKPPRGIYISAGFIFCTNEAIKSVPYDPDFYFSGEECAMAVRYFTHGFNIYNSHKVIVHHYYQRLDHKKHWSDHSNWSVYNNVAHERLDCLLGRSDKYDLGIYGLGNVRTLEDYRLYSGIDFKNKIVHKETADGVEPPCSNSDIGWDNEIVTFEGSLTWDQEKIAKCEDPRFWAMIIMDQDGIAIHREDISYKDNKDKDISYKDNKDIIEGKVNYRKFTFDRSKNRQIPTTLLIWPYSESKKWLQSTSFPFKQL